MMRAVGTAPRSVGIVGAGPAGIMAALKAASLGADVHLYDTNQSVGRKLTVAGNGRCNLTNANVRPEAYTTDDPMALAAALSRYGYPELLADLNDLGIPTYATPDGWTYPMSNSGAAVVEILTEALRQAGVHMRLLTKITAIQRRGNSFALELGNSPHHDRHDRMIVASGGMAYGALGSRGECFPMLESLGHTILPVRPALSPLTADMRALHKLQGVRLDVSLSLYAEGRLLGQSLGNLMFTQGGLSGPAPMNVAHLVSIHPDATLEARIDLVPFHAKVLEELLDRGRACNTPATVVLAALMPPKLPPVLLRLAGLPADARLGILNDAELARLRRQVHALTVRVTGTRPLSQSQLSTGGVPLAEVDPATMASRLVPGLHLAGEVLNVVGPCGGYNLHWAMASGAIAGLGASQAGTAV